MRSFLLCLCFAAGRNASSADVVATGHGLRTAFVVCINNEDIIRWLLVSWLSARMHSDGSYWIYEEANV